MYSPATLRRGAVDQRGGDRLAVEDVQQRVVFGHTVAGGSAQRRGEEVAHLVELFLMASRTGACQAFDPQLRALLVVQRGHRLAASVAGEVLAIVSKSF